MLIVTLLKKGGVVIWYDLVRIACLFKSNKGLMLPPTRICLVNTAPSLLVYDNACKLHLYALKREPVRFKRTRFMVDRLHYRKGHVGCTLGYSMDSYVADPAVASINSQTNEQANSSLRRLATQLTYMTPENVMMHTAVFLGIRNMDKKHTT